MKSEEESFKEKATLFESYHSGILEGKDKVDFERQLTKDAVFRSEFEDYKTGLTLVEGLGMADLMKEVVRDKQKGKRLTFTFVARVVAIAAVLIIGYFFLKPDVPESSQGLFSKHFAAYPNIYSSRTNTIITNRDRALSFYESGNFEKALAEFELLKSPDDTTCLYMGVSELAMGNTSKAKERLSPITNEFLLEAREWYLALACLQANERDSVAYYLKSLGNSNKYSKAAEDILSHGYY